MKLMVKKEKMRKQGGFSLVEIMVVVAIIAVLATVAVPQFVTATEKARAAKESADIQTISSAAQLYMSEKGATTAPTVEALYKDGYLAEHVKTNKGEEYTITYDIKDGSSVKKISVTAPVSP